MKRLAAFFRSPLKSGHEAGAGEGRPWWRTVKTLMLAGLVALPMLAAQPAQAFTSDPFNPGNPMNMLNPLSPWCQVCDDPDNMSWEDHRRVDAIKIQAEEQGISNPNDDSLVIDEDRVSAYVADRVEERDAKNAAETREDRWRLEALQQQAEAQGLPGWAADGFREDRTQTRIYVEQAREAQERADTAMKWVLGGLAGGGALVLGGQAIASNRRRREWEAEQERRRQDRESRRGRDGSDFKPFI